MPRLPYVNGEMGPFRKMKGRPIHVPTEPGSRLQPLCTDANKYLQQTMR